VVKPARQGSALGIRIAHKKSELPDKIIEALNFDDKILIEKYLKGREISISILGNRYLKALPPVEIVPHKEYFDFESMYSMGKTDYYVPARLSKSMYKKVEKIALDVHKILRCRDVSRTDMIVDEKLGPQMLEINTSPGLTETSLLPMAAEAINLSFENLIEKIVKMALKRSH
ncbi:MAG: D-alanine--D-alanine ligase, partial [Actinobacteria bacterium]